MTKRPTAAAADSSAPPSSAKGRSLTRATLYRVALGVTLIVAVSSGVTYQLLYREIEQRALERLREYAVQRAEYQESRFSLIKAFHEVVKADFVARYTQPMPDAERRFAELMTRDPDGAYRNSSAFSDVQRYSTGWIHRRVQPDAEFKRLWVLFFDISEHYSRLVTSRFTNFYLMHPVEPANMGYDDPKRSGNVQWAASTPADYALHERESFMAANAANNPQRQTVWAGPVLEPAYDKVMVSAITPIYLGDEHIATIASDDTLEDLQTSILRSDIPGTHLTVFRADGRLVVDARYMERIIEGSNGLNINEAGDPRLDALLRLAAPAGGRPLYGYSGDIDHYYAISQVPSTGWYFASTLPGQLIRGQAFQATQWVLWIGLASLGLLLASLALILRRQVGRPLGQLLEGIRSAEAGEIRTVPASGSDEVGHLALAFNAMLGKVSERDAALRVEKERFRALIENAADVIIIVDAQGAVSYVGPSIETVLGVRPDALLDRPMLDHVHEEDRSGLAAALHAVIGKADAVVERTEFRMRHTDGSWRWMEAAGTNQIANTAVGGIVINARDVTAAKLAEAELARQRESVYQREKLAAMGSLLAGVAHELNNPLSIVVARATLLEEATPDPTMRSSVEKIRAAAERCARIVRTFLAMARQGKPQHGAVAINDVLEDCLDMLAYSLRTAGVGVEKDLAQNLAPVSGNADQLHQVFLNLIVNAQQALEGWPPPRRLSVVTRPDGPTIVVQIADNGPGVPEPIRSRIFDPYFTTKPVGGGTGVGLAVSLGIVDGHGGTLTVACPPSGGAMFEVRLPVHAVDPNTERIALGAAEPLGNGKRRFLIVDDEPELGLLLADILREDAALIDVASSGREALERLRERDYDTILTDLRMPEMDGPELYRQIEQRWPKLAARVVFISGDALSPSLQRFLAETDRPLIEKPFAPAEVRQRCRTDKVEA